MKKILLILILTISSNANAQWWFSEGFQLNFRYISDEPLEIKLGDMLCGVTKTNYGHMENDDGIVESRDLYCRLTNNTLVSVSLTCHLPGYEVIQLKIGEGPTGHYPMLGCSPRKK
jgi:hypothetical protein